MNVARVNPERVVDKVLVTRLQKQISEYTNQIMELKLELKDWKNKALSMQNGGNDHSIETENHMFSKSRPQSIVEGKNYHLINVRNVKSFKYIIIILINNA